MQLRLDPNRALTTATDLPPLPVPKPTATETEDVLEVRALPPAVAHAKAQVLRIARENVDAWGDEAVAEALAPHVEVLANHFANNRPSNELELTKGAWLNEWLSLPEEIDFRAFGFSIDRSQVYQIVRDGYYYNIADVKFLRFPVFTSLLKGFYEIVDPASEDTSGQRERNVISLEFDVNLARLGTLPRDRSLIDYTEQADEVQAGRLDTFEVPGPRGVTGRLFNLYIDEDLRVSFGRSDGDDPGGLFVLSRVDEKAAR
ncbi:MAG: hypothetical protein AAF658_04435 [Myxococcota bacterium]